MFIVTLITNGIYQKICQPMYTSVWLWCIAQVLLMFFNYRGRSRFLLILKINTQLIANNG
jgi:protein-S-isoprenylcysteine O-methyltransferase Ste14